MSGEESDSVMEFLERMTTVTETTTYLNNEMVNSSDQFTSLMNITSANNSSFGDLTLQCFNQMTYKAVTQLGLLFYIHIPKDHYYKNAEDVKSYEVWVVPALAFLIVLEQVIRLFQKKRNSRIQDMIINVGSALLNATLRVFLLGLVVTVMVHIYSNYRLITLPVNSLWTWLISILLVELLYYWTHRAFHEINFLWATHQYHHMAEDLSVTTGIRNSVVDLICFDIFPIPLAFFIPPPILAVHIQFVLLCQLWIHNEVIPQLGPLEYVINTAGNHRVHHGRNPYCIDKNYSALLMVWDHLFGTYQHEKEKIVFGVVSKHPDTFDMLTLQFGYYKLIWDKFQEVEGWKNKFSVFFKGPGWSPGKPRLGLLSDVPEPDLNEPKFSYDPFVPLWHKMYVAAHGFLILFGFYLLADHRLVKNSWLQIFLGIFYIIFSLTAFGALFDRKQYAPLLEIARCLFYFAIDYVVIHGNAWNLTDSEAILMLNLVWLVRIFHIASILLWMARCVIYHESMYVVQKTVNEKLAAADLESGQNLRLTDAASLFTVLFIIFSGILLFGALFLQVDPCNQLFHIVSNSISID